MKINQSIRFWDNDKRRSKSAQSGPSVTCHGVPLPLVDPSSGLRQSPTHYLGVRLGTGLGWRDDDDQDGNYDAALFRLARPRRAARHRHLPLPLWWCRHHWSTTPQRRQRTFVFISVLLFIVRQQQSHHEDVPRHHRRRRRGGRCEGWQEARVGYEENVCRAAVSLRGAGHVNRHYMDQVDVFLSRWISHSPHLFFIVSFFTLLVYRGVR